MVQYIITPWRNPRELLEVRDVFYPEKIEKGKELEREDMRAMESAGEEEKRNAVAKVQMWMQRGNCPHLVDSTAILTSAVLNDGVGEELCVRVAYAAAFSRFVTGLLDSHQDKAQKVSMYNLAKKLGLPATFVELRHQSTHEELPSVLRLRAVTKKALEWMWDYYWNKLPDYNELETVDDLINGFPKDANVEARERLLLHTRGHLPQAACLTTLMNHDFTPREKHDVGKLTLVSWLTRRIWSESDQSRVLRSESSELATPAGLPDLKTEMEEMRRKLTQDEEAFKKESEEKIRTDQLSKKRKRAKGEDTEVDVEDGDVEDTVNIKGWALLEGPWVPKPIGVV